MSAIATPSLRQTIVTKYHGPSNVKGSRVSATCDAGRIYLEWDDALNSEQNHAAACEALCKKIGRDSQYVGGFIDSGAACVWVEDCGRLKALRGFVNDYRNASWSGNPWCKTPFQEAVRTIGAAFGFHGEVTSAPTTDAEVAEFIAKRGY